MSEKKILIIDDSSFARKILKDMLIKNGYGRIFEAANGNDALEIYKNENLDLVLLDLIMEGMDGVEVLEKIIEVDKNANVLVTSALGQDTIVNQCMNIGSKGFIVKPVNEVQLIDEIRRVIER